MSITSTARRKEKRGSLVRCKVILCGPAGVGKTSFFARCLGRKFDPVAPVQPTVGVDMHVMRYTQQGRMFELALWDTAGQEAFMSLTSSFYRGADACLVFVDLSDTTKEKWRARQQELEKWLKTTRERVEEDCLVLCVGTKRDQCTHQLIGGNYEENDNSKPDTFPQFIMSQLQPEEKEKGTLEFLFNSTESLFVTSSRHDLSSCFVALLLICCRQKLSIDELEITSARRTRPPPQPKKKTSVALQAATIHTISQEPINSFFNFSC